MLKVVAAVMLVALWSAGAGAADFYMSPGGNDANPGTAERPVASLAGARDLVRRFKQTHPNANIVVHIAGGTYRLTDTVVFSLADSASDGHTITYEAESGQTPAFTAGVPITAWQKLDNPPAGLPPAARGHVWVADVSSFRALKEKQPAPVTATDLGKLGWQFRTLYEGDRRLPRARGRGFTPTNGAGRGSNDYLTLHYPDGALQNWPDVSNAELLVIPCFYWTMDILPIVSVNEAEHVATLAEPSTYPLEKNGMTDRDSCWVENALEVLDKPGEWVLDTRSAKLYLWPLGDRPGTDIVAPALTELIRIEGNIDYDGATDVPVRGLRFRGLTFTQGDRMPWHGRSGWGLQHDWEHFDSPTALVRLRGAENCAFEDCRFTNSGHTGIRLDLYCQHNRIVGNEIDHIGGAGVLLDGYGPGTKDVNKDNEVSDNYIHDIGEIYWGMSGIFAWQSGENHIAHNNIGHTPYAGIVVSGRIAWDKNGVGECSRTVRWKELQSVLGDNFGRLDWYHREPFLHGRNNIVERNDIHNVMQICGDGNCIYVSGTGKGNVIRENYCHDCDGEYMNAAIRCDDDQNGTTIGGNIIYRTRGFGEGVISKGDNDILNNIIADLRPYANHRGYLVFPYGSLKGSVIRHNILYSCRKEQIDCFEGGSLHGGPVPRLRDASVDYNLYYCTADSQWGTDELTKQRPFGIEAHSVVADPLFRDIGHGDFDFQPNSPALKLGIKPPVPLSEIGLEPPYRNRLIGKVITMTIAPSDQMLRAPVTVTMSADLPGAAIHYTVDGTEPSPSSPAYSGPFRQEQPCVMRARAFAPGATDLIGAVTIFTSPPQPIIQDFEAVKVGDPTPGATTNEENTRMTARVTDEQAATGHHSLKFIDGPGQKYAFNPHVFYRVKFDSGRVVGSFDLRIDEQTMFYSQWREYNGSAYCEGPTVTIQPGGKLVHDGRVLLTIPPAQWVHFEVACELGDAASGKFDMKVTLPGHKEPVVFHDLPCNPAFKRLDWLGFVPNGEKATTVYVDNIELKPEE